jgi:hypothetical protein
MSKLTHINKEKRVNIYFCHGKVLNLIHMVIILKLYQQNMGFQFPCETTCVAEELMNFQLIPDYQCLSSN